MWAGVLLALLVCTGVAVGLQLADEALPQRQQEMLETVVAGVAVAIVTWMVFWMRRNARGLAGDLRANAASALARGSWVTLVGMAFFAVLREGIETAVFLLAAFQASSDPTAAGSGAALGVLVAVVIGYGIYRGGVRLNLARFFRLTAVVLVLVAAGLVSSALHSAHEAGWLSSWQQEALDLSSVVRPGTTTSALVTGMLGIQPHPTVAELTGWLLYAIPMLAFVLWPSGAKFTGRKGKRVLTTTTAGALLLLAMLAAGCGGGGGDDTASTTATRTVKLTIGDDGCAPASVSVPSGAVTFEVSNSGSSAVTELELLDDSGTILGERENVVEGVPASFTLNLEPGSYTLYCPNGAKVEKAKLTVTGTPAGTAKPAPTQAYADAAAGYHAYVAGETAQLVKGTRQFVAALKRGDLQAATRLYGPVRYHYEAIEPVAESFGDLDPAIDARADDVEDPKDWTGFHRIENILWTKGTTDGTAALGNRLLADVKRLQAKVQTLSYQPAQMANGAVELLNEVAASKITGEEDRYSHTDLSDLAANVEGARRAFALVRPILVERGHRALATTIDGRFASVDDALSGYRRSTPLRFALYGSLTADDRRRLSTAVDALAEPLSTVAAKVAS
jgi:iron uptake system component EfeO